MRKSLCTIALFGLLVLVVASFASASVPQPSPTSIHLPIPAPWPTPLPPAVAHLPGSPAPTCGPDNPCKPPLPPVQNARHLPGAPAPIPPVLTLATLSLDGGRLAYKQDFACTSHPLPDGCRLLCCGSVCVLSCG